MSKELKDLEAHIAANGMQVWAFDATKETEDNIQEIIDSNHGSTAITLVIDANHIDPTKPLMVASLPFRKDTIHRDINVPGTSAPADMIHNSFPQVLSAIEALDANTPVLVYGNVAVRMATNLAENSPRQANSFFTLIKSSISHRLIPKVEKGGLGFKEGCKKMKKIFHTLASTDMPKICQYDPQNHGWVATGSKQLAFSNEGLRQEQEQKHAGAGARSTVPQLPYADAAQGFAAFAVPSSNPQAQQPIAAGGASNFDGNEIQYFPSAQPSHAGAAHSDGNAIQYFPSAQPSHARAAHRDGNGREYFPSAFQQIGAQEAAQQPLQQLLFGADPGQALGQSSQFSFQSLQNFGNPQLPSGVVPGAGSHQALPASDELGRHSPTLSDASFQPKRSFCASDIFTEQEAAELRVLERQQRQQQQQQQQGKTQGGRSPSPRF